MQTELPASQMTVDQTGFALPWQCFIDAEGYIHPLADATIEPDGGGTRCISVICLDDGCLLGAFAHGVTVLSFSDIRRWFKS